MNIVMYNLKSPYITAYTLRARPCDAPPRSGGGKRLCEKRLQYIIIYNYRYNYRPFCAHGDAPPRRGGGDARGRARARAGGRAEAPGPTSVRTATPVWDNRAIQLYNYIIT